MLILEGIGMTENTSFTNVNRFDNYRFGWVGLEKKWCKYRNGSVVEGLVLAHGGASL